MSIRQGLLALLADQPMYGAQLRAEFEARTGGTWPLNVGQVYQTLARLDGVTESAVIGVPDERLARGPGCLTRALGITMADAGTDLFSEASPVRLMLPDAGEGDDAAPVIAGPRVGVPRAAEEPLRFFLAGDPTVSAYRRAASLR